MGYESPFLASVIGAAWSCANELKPIGLRETIVKWMNGPAQKNKDVDDEEHLSRRAWCVLVILDQWRSIPTATLPLISTDWIHLEDYDRHNLGEVGYNLVRISCLLGEIAGARYSMLSRHLEASFNGHGILESLYERIAELRKTESDSLDRNPVLNVAWWYGSRLTLLTIGTPS